MTKLSLQKKIIQKYYSFLQLIEHNCIGYCKHPNIFKQQKIRKIIVYQKHSTLYLNNAATNNNLNQNVYKGLE